MGQRVEVNYQPGDLVRWHERYADGFMIRDVGSGVVIKRKTYDITWMNGGKYVNYVVYRTKHEDTMIFEEIELERISDE